MADQFEIELIETVEEFWLFNFPLYSHLYVNGKNPKIFHCDLYIDTLGAALAEIAKPTNVVANFVTPQQVYIRSTEAADVSLSITVVGQKSDGVVATYTLTTNASDGTTAVDCGTWYWIGGVVSGTTAAGNLVVDDDGASGTVYFTCTLGANPKLATLYVPNGYKGCLMAMQASLTAIPGASANGNVFQFYNDYDFLIDTTSPHFSEGKYKHVVSQNTQYTVKGLYKTAITACKIHFYFIVWEA